MKSSLAIFGLCIIAAIFGGAFWLASQRNDVVIDSNWFGKIVVHPPAAGPPPACNDIMTALSKNEAIVAETNARLKAVGGELVNFGVNRR